MALAMTSRSTLSKRLTSGTSMISTYRISMKSMRKSLPILLTCRNTEQASKLSSTHDEKYCSGREKHSDINLLLSLQLIPNIIDQKTSILEQCLKLHPWKINVKTSLQENPDERRPAVFFGTWYCSCFRAAHCYCYKTGLIWEQCHTSGKLQVGDELLQSLPWDQRE